MSDYQKTRCYRWEGVNMAPLGQSEVALENAQAFVDHIWSGEGLQYPPRVSLMNHSTTVGASANRLEIFVPPVVKTWILIHEIAHSMSSTFDGASCGHGPTWVGLYIKLACKYMGGDMLTLMTSARRAGVDFDITAFPVFVD